MRILLFLSESDSTGRDLCRPAQRQPRKPGCSAAPLEVSKDPFEGPYITGPFTAITPQGNAKMAILATSGDRGPLLR